MMQCICRYTLMSSCWNENPLMRPSFTDIVNQLEYLLREVKVSETGFKPFPTAPFLIQLFHFSINYTWVDYAETFSTPPVFKCRRDLHLTRSHISPRKWQQKSKLVVNGLLKLKLHPLSLLSLLSFLRVSNLSFFHRFDSSVPEDIYQHHGGWNH